MQNQKTLEPASNEIVTRYNEGESLLKLAAAFSCSAPTVGRFLRGKGVTIRPKGRVPRNNHSK